MWRPGDRVRARLPPLTYIGFPSLHVASLCNCCCRPAAVLFRVLAIASHTHASRVNFSLCYVPWFPCGVFGTTTTYSRQSSLVGLPRSNVTAFCVFRELFLLLFQHFSTYQIPACYQFSARSLAVDTRQYSESVVQVRPTSTVHDGISNIIFQTHITHLRPNIDFQLAGKPT